MSEHPVDQLTDEVLRPSPLPAGRSPMAAITLADPLPKATDGLGPVQDTDPPTVVADPLTGEDAEARFQALVAEVRREESVFDRHGGLSRFDEEDDPNRGSLLYDAVVFQDTTQLNGGGWLDRIEAIDRIEARLAGLKAEAITNFDDAVHGVSADLGNRHPEPGDRDAAAGERRWHGGDLRSVSDELGLVLNLHRGAATRRIHSSWDLVHNYPATLEALTEGLLTERAAFTIVAELSVLDDIEDIRAAEAAVLDWARSHPLQKIKQAARREAAGRNPSAADKAHRKACDERSVRMVTSDFGTADVIHTQDAADAAAVMTSLSRAAVRRRRNGDSRTFGQLCADIALDRLLRKRTTPVNADEPADVPAPTDANGPTDVQSPVDSSACADGAAFSDDAVPGSGCDSEADTFDDDLADEDSAGADATVVIHATGAELRALLEDREATGGEVEGLGPIPQNSLRKHLIKAISQTLLPNLPTTPTRRRSRPTFNQHTRSAGTASHGAHPADASSHGSHSTDGSNHGSSTGGSSHGSQSTDSAGSGSPPPDDSGRGSARTDASARHPGPTEGAPTGTRGSRIEVRVTDAAPAGDPDRYVPSAATDRYVRWRDRTCQFPGCNRPAEFTDLDHRVAFTAGGRTTVSNLHCLCRHHHRLKHEGGWHIHRNPDGTHTWTSPTGRRYREGSPDPHPDTPRDDPPDLRPAEPGSRSGDPHPDTSRDDPPDLHPAGPDNRSRDPHPAEPPDDSADPEFD